MQKIVVWDVPTRLFHWLTVMLVAAGLCNLAAQLDGLARVCWLRAARARSLPAALRRAGPPAISCSCSGERLILRRLIG